jgi:hypothetical protein
LVSRVLSPFPVADPALVGAGEVKGRGGKFVGGNESASGGRTPPPRIHGLRAQRTASRRRRRFEKGLQPLPLLRGQLGELQAYIELVLPLQGTTIVPEYLGLESPRRRLAFRREAQHQRRVALQIVVEEEVMPFNQRMVGLKTGSIERDIGKTPAHFPRARKLGDGVPHAKFHLNGC